MKNETKIDIEAEKGSFIDNTWDDFPERGVVGDSRESACVTSAGYGEDVEEETSSAEGGNL